MNKHILVIVFLASIGSALAQNLPYQAEGLPDNLIARVEVRDRFLNELPASTNGFSPQFVLETLKRWPAGSTVRVAFNGGSNALRKGIADTAASWLAYGNIQLDFGYNSANGTYRSWSLTDTDYKAHIRISFSHGGYWSLVGMDSEDPVIISPGEASMNFGGFAVSLPSNWKAIVVHEFGHAFGFHHEHQSPVGGCESQFRWYNDPGYQPTRDQYGQYIIDSLGRRPGIYTVLGGPPNNWPAMRVDHNLRQLRSSTAFNVGPFDSKSIMMYSFPTWMFVAPNSPCYTAENATLSKQDQAGFMQAYPFTAAEMVRQQSQRREFLNTLINAQILPQSKERFKAMFNAVQ
jgi:hypothetical protein